MVLAAKSNSFDRVFKILEERKYLINGIPEKRAWSALHQAVYQANTDAVIKLLAFVNCDINIHAKRDRNEITAKGETPLQLAKSRNFQEIVKILSEKHTSATSDAPTFVDITLGKKYTNEGMPLFWLASAFLPDNVVQSLLATKPASFLSMTQGSFAATGEHFHELRNSLAETLYPFSQDLFTCISDIDDYSEFLQAVIHIYTKCQLYGMVNSALRRSSEDLNPTGNDLLLCLYAFLLESILLHWDELQNYRGTSYRGCEMTDKEIAMYQKDTEFMWMSFTSSSKARTSAFSSKNVMFIIDNQCESKWGPKDIAELSAYQGEQEVLYPAGAKFVVSAIEKVHQDNYKIRLKLLQ